MIDLRGHTCGMLTIISYAYERKGHYYWNCRCACGATSVVDGGHLRGKNVISCGCARRQGSHRHGHASPQSPEYRAWRAMLNRCHLPSHKMYPHYGGRGICVSQRWRKSFAAFLMDMGLRPTPKHTIDRLNVHGHYSRDNCRWATPQEQGRNTRRNHQPIFRGERACISEWAERLGLTHKLISTRLSRGWSTERALTTPVARQ